MAGLEIAKKMDRRFNSGGTRFVPLLCNWLLGELWREENMLRLDPQDNERRTDVAWCHRDKRYSFLQRPAETKEEADERARRTREILGMRYYSDETPGEQQATQSRQEQQIKEEQEQQTDTTHALTEQEQAEQEQARQMEQEQAEWEQWKQEWAAALQAEKEQEQAEREQRLAKIDQELARRRQLGLI